MAFILNIERVFRRITLPYRTRPLSASHPLPYPAPYSVESPLTRDPAHLRCAGMAALRADRGPLESAGARAGSLDSYLPRSADRCTSVACLRAETSGRSWQLPVHLRSAGQPAPNSPLHTSGSLLIDDLPIEDASTHCARLALMATTGPAHGRPAAAAMSFGVIDVVEGVRSAGS